MDNIKAGFIGCGNMGGVLAAVAAKSLGLTPGLKSRAVDGPAVLVTDHNKDKVDHLVETFGCKASSAEEIARKCSIIFLGVKPQVMAKACEEIRPTLEKRLKTEEQFCVVSMAAGLKIEAFDKMLGGVPVIRMMPNTPCATGAGVILYALGKLATQEDEQNFMQLMRPAGLIMRMDEEKIDKGCALSGCGPAFVYMFIDAMIDASVRIGLPRAEAKQLAIQTALGSAMMCAQSGSTEPAKLKADVCSPGGSTIEGVAVLEDYSLRAAVMEAVKAAYDRTVELGK